MVGNRRGEEKKRDGNEREGDRRGDPQLQLLNPPVCALVIGGITICRIVSLFKRVTTVVMHKMH